MSEADRSKWNARYAQGAYADRTHPGAYLTACLAQLPPVEGSFALDVACGAGRNSLYLAQQGYVVDAVDIAEEGLRRLAAQAEPADVAITTHAMDLDAITSGAARLPRDSYALIIMFRYVDMDLLSQLTGMLVPGGHIIVEEHLRTTLDVIGPSSPRFRVAPGALQHSMEDNGMVVRHSYEGVVEEPDGSAAALAQIWAMRAT